MEKAKWFEEQVRNDPAVDTVNVTAGSNAGGRGGGNNANMFIQLKPYEERGRLTSDQVIARIRQKTPGMPGAILYLQSNQDIRIGGRQSNAQYQYTLQTQDLDLLALWGPRVLATPVPASATGGRQFGPAEFRAFLECHHRPRHRFAARLTAQAVDSALYDAFGQRQVSTMYKSINQYHVVLALEQQWWESPAFLEKIYVQTPRGLSIPLSTFAHFTEGITPLSLPHQGQFPATTISFNLPDGVSLSDAVTPSTKPNWTWAARQHHRQFRRHGAGVPGFVVQPAHPDRHRAAGRLHHSGHAV